MFHLQEHDVTLVLQMIRYGNDATILHLSNYIFSKTRPFTAEFFIASAIVRHFDNTGTTVRLYVTSCTTPEAFSAENWSV